MQAKNSVTLNLQYAALNNASVLYSNFLHLIFLIQYYTLAFQMDLILAQI